MLDWVERQGLGRKEDRIRLVSRQAVYNLILKLMLYEMLRQKLSLAPVSIDSLGKLQQLFKTAHQKSGMEAFANSFLDEIVEGCNDELSKNLSNVARLVEKVEENRADFIGRVYEDIIPGEERRRLGEFYTPRDIAEFMTRWAIVGKNDRVSDPACGSATFLVESLYRLVELKCSAEEAVKNIYGIDINPLAILMSTVNMVARVPESTPNVSVSDFLRMTRWDREKFQAIVCNPPYSRHHELPQNYKELVARTIDEECGEKISRLSSIYVHFFIHAASFLDDGGRMAFITPSEFLDVDYGVELKRFLLKAFTLRSLILYSEETLVFPEALTTACITLLEKKKPSPEHNVIFVRLNKSLEPRELLEVIQSEQSKKESWGTVELIPQSNLRPEDKWSYLTSTPSKISGLIPLGNIASAHRGIATGANDFFALSENEIRRYGIEREFLKPIVTNARSIPHYNFTKKDFQKLAQRGDKVWLLFCDRPKDELTKYKNLLRYLASGESKGLDRRYLTSKRKVWYFQERRTLSPILFTYMSRENPRFVHNEAGALALNALHTIHPVDRIANDKRKVKALLCYLNSGICRELLKKTGRVYGGGLVKLEPHEVENLPVIDLDKLSHQELLSLETLFDKLCESSREGRAEAAREKIDDTLDGIIKKYK